MNSVFTKIDEAKQQRIIQTALQEFAQHGYINTSTNQIVKKLGISKGSLFKYFSTKEDLYQYLVEYACEQLCTHLDKANIEAGFWPKVLLAYAECEFDFLINQPILYNFFYRMLNDIKEPALEVIKDNLYKESNRYLDRIYALVNWGNPIFDEEILITHITYVLKGYNEWFKENNENISKESKEKYINGLKQHFNLILKGAYS